MFVKMFKKLQELMIVLVLMFFGFSSYIKDRREYFASHFEDVHLKRPHLDEVELASGFLGLSRRRK